MIKEIETISAEKKCIYCKTWNEQYKIMDQELFLTGYSFIPGQNHDLRWCAGAISEDGTVMLTKADSERKCFK